MSSVNLYVSSQTCMSFSFCGSLLQCVVSLFNELWNTRMWVQWMFLYRVKRAYVLFIFWFVFPWFVACFNALWIGIASEFDYFSCLKSNLQSCSFCVLSWPCFINYFNALWITSWWVQWIFNFQVKSAFLNFMVCLCHLCCLLPYTVDYKRVSLINFQALSQNYVSCWYCGLPLPCSFVYFNVLWITSGWVECILVY